MRPIDADVLLNNTDGLEHVKWSQEYGHVVLVCDIVYAPTLDVVEVVRCKDCIYGEQDEIERWFCRNFGCQVGDENGNGFCADGERKDGDGDE